MCFQLAAYAPAPRQIRAPRRGLHRGSAIAKPGAAMSDGFDPAAPVHFLLAETVRAVGTITEPDLRCVVALPGRSRARRCAIVPVQSWRPWCLRRVRWRARTPASAAPAIAAEAARDNPSAARWMSDSCAGCKMLVEGRQNRPTVMVIVAALRSRLGRRPNGPAQAT